MEISKDAIKKFRKQFPNIQVDPRDGALLGVTGLDQGQGVIDIVTKGSAADKAGIVAGDRITEFNGNVVPDFKALTDSISLYKAGDTATLTVERGGKTRKVKVTFGGWSKSQMLRLKSTNRIQVFPNENRIIQPNRPIKPRAIPATPPAKDTEKPE